MTMRPTIGLIVLARPTFDMDLAGSKISRALAVLDRIEVEVIGSREPVLDTPGALAAVDLLRGARVNRVLAIQATFTDAVGMAAVADAIDAPIAIWGFPEPRTGGRLRLNALCGINLAAHALGRRGRTPSYLYADPETAEDDLRTLLAARPPERSAATGSRHVPVDDARLDEVVGALRGARIGLVGQHPDGFDTCSFDEAELARLADVSVERIALGDVFAAAASESGATVAAIRKAAEAAIDGLDELEQEPLDRSLRTFGALSTMARAKGLSGMAVRCWPEFFTEYGCAACGAMSMLSEGGIPAACEADVLGNLTSILLQASAREPVFMADLVDADAATDTAVFWHCGLAPVSLAEPSFRPRGTIHSNRRKPLLAEFPLKAGRVTVARLSKSGGSMRLVIAGGQMQKAPMSFSGTSGVARFDRPIGPVLDTIIAEGLEHHYGIAYGEHRPLLRAIAGRLGLPVLELA